VPVIYTMPVSRSDSADVVMPPTDLSAETGVPPLTNAIEGTTAEIRTNYSGLLPTGQNNGPTA
jgi:hypothetical protein